MRFLLVAAIAVIVLGSVQGYLTFVRSIPRPQLQRVVRQDASGQFHVVVTLSFEATGDAFDPESLQISLNNQVLLQSEEAIAADQQLRLSDVTGVKVGGNEFYVRAIGGETEPLAARALRIQIFRDREELASATLWAEPGEPVEGQLKVEVPASDEPVHETDH